MLNRLFILFGFVVCLTSARAQDYPSKPNTLVTDYTGTLADTDKQQLENKLVAFDNSTSTQIMVVLIKTTGSTDIDDYSTGLARSWGIGQKGKNNGILILVAVDDRRVMVKTGYGAVGAISDNTANQIIRDDIVPRFKTNDYYGGLDAATNHIMQLIRNDYTNDSQQQAQQQQQQAQQQQPATDNGNGTGVIVIIIIVVVVLITIFRRRGGGGGGQIIGSRGGASPFWWFLGGTLLGGGLGSGWGGDWGGNDNGGDGDWGGNDNGGDGDPGSSGDSGGGGGDFGGFGGGDFGGDGSSGSW